jgi:hypothetical protein
MKTILALLLALVTESAKADWKAKTIDVLLYASGIVVSLAVHEAAHELTASAYGEKLTWSDGEWICRNQSDTAPCENIDKVAIAGNLSTAILGESLMFLPARYRYTPFVDGMQTFNAVNPVVYAYKDSVTSGGHLDYRYVDDNVQIAIAIHAASIGYRQFSDRTRYIFVTPRSVQFNMAF